MRGGALHAFGLQQSRLRGNFHRFGHRADFQRQVAQSQFVIGVQRDAGPVQLLKARLLRRERVVARLQAGDSKITLLVGLGGDGDVFVGSVAVTVAFGTAAPADRPRGLTSSQ